MPFDRDLSKRDINKVNKENKLITNHPHFHIKIFFKK